MFGLCCPLGMNLSSVTVVVESEKVGLEAELLKRGGTGLLGKPALPHSEAAEPPAWQECSCFCLLPAEWSSLQLTAWELWIKS